MNEQNKPVGADELAAIEREHFGDPEKGTGIYAALSSQPVQTEEDEITEARIKQAREAAEGFIWACGLMDSAMKDGLNVHGALYAVIGTYHNLQSALAAQPVREPMSEEQVVKALQAAAWPFPLPARNFDALRFARAIERHHGITKE